MKNGSINTKSTPHRAPGYVPDKQGKLLTGPAVREAQKAGQAAAAKRRAIRRGYSSK